MANSIISFCSSCGVQVVLTKEQKGKILCPACILQVPIPKDPKNIVIGKSKNKK